MNPEPENKKLFNKGIRALKWIYIGKFISMTLQFVVGVILARILGPDAFGLVAIYMIVQGLGNLVTEGGLGIALVQNQKITEHDIRSVFSVQSYLGLIISISVACASSILASFFNQPKAENIIIVMSSCIFIQSLGQTSNSLLQKELGFKKQQLINLLSYCVGYLIVGLPLSFGGAGVWSLVFAQLTQVSVNSLSLYIVVRHPIFPLVSPFQCRFAKFGSMVVASNMTSWGIGNIDMAIIGRFFNSAALGAYSRAFYLVNMPMYVVTSAIQSVLLSVYSKTQCDNKTLLAGYLTSTGLLALVLFPVYGAFAGMSELIIPIIYGSKWGAMVDILLPLCLAMPVHAMLCMSGPLLTASGHPKLELKAQIVTLVFSIPCLLWSASFSILTVSWVVFGSYIVRFLLLSISTLSLLGSRGCCLIMAIILAVIISFLMYTIASVVCVYSLEKQLHWYYLLGTISLLGLLLFATVILLLRWFIGLKEIHGFIVSIGADFSPRLSKFL